MFVHREMSDLQPSCEFLRAVGMAGGRTCRREDPQSSWCPFAPCRPLCSHHWTSLVDIPHLFTTFAAFIEMFFSGWVWIADSFADTFAPVLSAHCTCEM